jgi:hypothetical protein
MNLGLLDVLHHAGDDAQDAPSAARPRPPRRVLKKTVKRRGAPDRPAHWRPGSSRRVTVVTDLHRAAAEDVWGRTAAGTDVLDRRRPRRKRRAVRRVLDLRRRGALNPRPRPGRSRQRSARRGTPASSRNFARRSGVWLPNWTITPRVLDRANREDVLGGERLEVEAVGGVVVVRRSPGCSDHHACAQPRAVIARAQIIEPDALADPVGAGAGDHDQGGRPARLAQSVRRRSWGVVGRPPELGCARRPSGGALQVVGASPSVASARSSAGTRRRSWSPPGSAPTRRPARSRQRPVEAVRDGVASRSSSLPVEAGMSGSVSSSRERALAKDSRSPPDRLHSPLTSCGWRPASAPGNFSKAKRGTLVTT